MKKIFTLIVALVATLSAMAQGMHGPLNFVGKLDIEVQGNVVYSSTDSKVVYSGSDIILPEVPYASNMTMPSFAIHNVTFNFDKTTMAVVFPKQNISETITVNGVEKSIAGTIEGSYSHTTNKMLLTVVFTYGSMPMPLTYTIDADYQKESAVQGVSEMVAEAGDGKVYSLDGKELKEVPAKGMYIVNGKKIVK